MNFTQLSEGEQQLLTVLGLMRFTHEDESLFLLDEPDTHLNPIWKLRYFDEIEKVVRLQDEASTGDSQLIITTHDPLMIGSLRKEQVRILKCDGGKVTVETPDENPQGMGFAGLLKSELFGLRSTVDTETLRRLDQRNHLYALGKKRKKAQDEQLTQLSAELAELGFASDFKDDLRPVRAKNGAAYRVSQTRADAEGAGATGQGGIVHRQCDPQGGQESMRWIDLENKKPTDADLPGWEPWSNEGWEEWLEESKRLLGEVEKLATGECLDLSRKAGKTKEAVAKLKERNEFIDDDSDIGAN